MCLLTVLLLPILACVTSPNPNREAIKGLYITMEVNQLEEFRAQLRKFADKHSLELTEKFYNKDNTFFFIEMNGDDFHISLANNKDNLKNFHISFFNEASPPISQERLDDLVNDLKSFINEIPNVTITERILRLKIGIEEDQRKKIFAELFPQLQPLADKYSLESNVSSYDPYLETFLVEMKGEGFRITIDARQNLTREINLIFYMEFDNNVIPTTIPTPEETLDQLVNDLKNYLSEIPNVTITEVK